MFAPRAGIAGQDPSSHVSIRRGIATSQIVERRWTQPERLRVHDKDADVAVAQLMDRRGRRRRQLVQTIVAVDHKGAFRTVGAEDLRHPVRHRGSATPVTWRRTRAGLANGPRMLNTVGTPLWRVGMA